MRTRRVVVALVAAVGLIAVSAACGPPPGGGPTTTLPEPPELPVAPRMLMDPIGAEGKGIVSLVWGIDGYRPFLSTATSHSELDPTDAEDRALLDEASGQIDPATGRRVVVVGDQDAFSLEMCDTAGDDAVCEPIPGSERFLHPRFSPDGALLAVWKSDDVLEQTTLRLIDSTTYEVITEVVDHELIAGPGRAWWNPTSTAVAFLQDEGVVTLEAAVGATPVVVTPARRDDLADYHVAQQLVGWSPQGRILSLWVQVEFSTWPPTATGPSLHSVAPDGQDGRHIATFDGTNGVVTQGLVAPDGSTVLVERRDIVEGGQTTTASVAVAYSDQVGAAPLPLSRPWTDATSGTLLGAEIAIVGFVDLPD